MAIADCSRAHTKQSEAHKLNECFCVPVELDLKSQNIPPLSLSLCVRAVVHARACMWCACVCVRDFIVLEIGQPSTPQKKRRKERCSTVSPFRCRSHRNVGEALHSIWRRLSSPWPRATFSDIQTPTTRTSLFSLSYEVLDTKSTNTR